MDTRHESAQLLRKFTWFALSELGENPLIGRVGFDSATISAQNNFTQIHLVWARM